MAVDLTDPTVRDYLGRDAPLTLADKAALPVAGPPIGVSSGPTGSNATGSAPGAASTVASDPSGGGSKQGAPADLGISLPEPALAAIREMPNDARSSLITRLSKLGQDGAKIATQLTKMFSDTETAGVLSTKDFTLTGPGGEPALNTKDFTLDGAEGDAINPKDFTLGGQKINTSLPGALPDATIAALKAAGLDPATFSLGGTEGGAVLDAAKFALNGSDGAGSVVNAADFSLGAGALETGAEGVGGSLGGVAGGAVAGKQALDILNNRHTDTDQKIHDLLGTAGAFVSNLYLPVVGGILANYVHEYVSTPVVEAIFGEFGNSTAWNKFPAALGRTLDATEGANQTLAVAIANAQTPEQMQEAVAAWKSSVGQWAGGFGEGSGAYDLPDEPGATGGPHEGGVSADFSPEIEGLRAELGAARGGGSMEERLTALRGGIGKRLGELDLTHTQPIAATGNLTPGQAKAVSDATGVSESGKSRAAVTQDIASKLAADEGGNPNQAAVESRRSDLEALYRAITGGDSATPAASWERQQYENAQVAGGGGD